MRSHGKNIAFREGMSDNRVARASCGNLTRVVADSAAPEGQRGAEWQSGLANGVMGAKRRIS